MSVDLLLLKLVKNTKPLSVISLSNTTLVDGVLTLVIVERTQELASDFVFFNATSNQRLKNIIGFSSRLLKSILFIP
jgi:hypothetical protein